MDGGGSTPSKPSAVPEFERFPTAASDPSQDDAVLRSRSAPGLVVEGPPGTGKSQTIVNIVTDAIGRGETVLVVCQKQAALTVVQKRLDAEGLGGRLFALVDGVRDREPVLRALRDQVQTVRDAPTRTAQLEKQRKDRAGAIEEVEGGLDRAHAALHAPDDGGDSYRDIVGELVGVEAAGLALDAPRLRRTLSKLDRQGAARLEEACAPLARLWLDSAYEGSALLSLRPFPVDEAVSEDLASDLAAFAAAEEARVALTPGAFDLDDPAPLQAWAAADLPALEALDGGTRIWLAAHLDLFRPGVNGGSEGARLTEGLRRCRRSLATLDAADHSDRMSPALAILPEPLLGERLASVAVATATATFFGRLRPGRIAARRAAAKQLRELGQADGEPALGALRRALGLEARLRPLRAEMTALERDLDVDGQPSDRDLAALRAAAASTLDALEVTATAAGRVLSCPSSGLAEAAARDPSPGAFAAFRTEVAGAVARHEARAANREALARLADRFEARWVGRCGDRIASGAATADLTRPVAAALPTLAAYQRFRIRAAGLGGAAMEAFATLRSLEARLGQAPDLDAVVRRTLRREWLKARKAAAEDRHPDLTLGREEIERRIDRLATLDDEMRALNKSLLAEDVAVTATQVRWNALTKMRGSGAKRLRELFDEGGDLGLMELRPVWLMSPDVVSRTLPLRAGLFDLVVFDEASQMPVEQAVPTLFRAKRVVIAGDEKQMPPSTFFLSRLAEDEGDDGAEDGGTEAERNAAEEAWDRRDIQSCPDLLQLGKGFLPVATLQIHYRSRFRELIGFSNAAYYGSALSVPARHPDDVVRDRRPVEVVRADGVYEAQTNRAEAERVVEELAALWARPVDDRPSVGVVTFNGKQADLVEEVVAARAAQDDDFRRALEEERARRQGGEDMGFFVKAVENVQGDERDVIVFSTTFGRDARGAFRRNFGVLGQAGGERRLNVAVTRAREKVILVTSIPVRQVSDWLGANRAPDKPRDYLQAYLDYAAKASAGDLRLARELMERFGRAARGAGRDMRGSGEGPDGFEASVAAFLESLGHAPVPAPAGADAFGLDFAIVDPATGLFGIGIECDAPRHPLLARARGREIWRRRVLERAVPRIYRVSSRDWYERGVEERARLAAAVEAAIAGKVAA